MTRMPYHTGLLRHRGDVCPQVTNIDRDRACGIAERRRFIRREIRRHQHHRRGCRYEWEARRDAGLGNDAG